MAAIDAEDRATVREDRTRPRLLLAQRMKPQHDRAAVRALLRVLGVAFAEAEIIAPVEAPIDVRSGRRSFTCGSWAITRGGGLGPCRTRGCLRRVRVRTAETSARRRWGWSARWALLTSPPRWRSTPCGMAPGVSDWMSWSLSMETTACWPRPRRLQRSVLWPCKAGARCRCCVRPTGWCCMRRAVHLPFFTW